jgi:hypothetical protein
MDENSKQGNKQSDKFTWHAGDVTFIPPDKNKPANDQQKGGK